jgi:hypothetical protein
VKRSTWIAVALAAVLVLAGNLPRLPWAALAARRGRPALARQVAAWPHLDRRAAPHAVALRAPLASLPTRHPHVAYAPPRLLATPASPRADRGPFGLRPRLSLPLQVALPALAGVLAGLLALVTLALSLRRDRRGHVWQLARRGFSPMRIARSTRVPQDAVRTLLTPGLGARR